MLGTGEKAPLEAVMWTTPRESATLGELLAASAGGKAARARPEDPAVGGRGGGPLLLLFYLFDWSAT